MKKITFLKTLLIVVLLTFGSISILAQTEVTYTFAEKGFTNAQIITNGNIDANLNYLAEKNSAGTAPTYYTSGSALRMYAGSGNGNSYTITPLNGVKITSIEIYALATYTPSVKYNVDGGGDFEATLNGTTYTISGIEALTSLKFRNALASGTTPQLRITGFKVTYTTSGGTPTVATPTFNPAAGTYTSTQNVSISTTTADASIYYTTNGDEPTELSTPYTAPVEISATTTLKAKAYKTGMDPSATATAEYTINVAPTISVTEVTIPAMSCTLDNNDTETINVSGTNLTSDIVLTIDGADAGMFSVTPSLSSTGGIATITYAPTSEGTHTATLRLNSAGATEVTKILNGKVVIPAVKGSVIITEVYGGGGNSGAILKNDFIELFNRTEESIDISGWSLQYYSSTGTGIATESNIFVIPEGKYIPAFRHFLIQAAAGAGGTDDLDKPDATCSLALSGTSGKVILYNTSEAQEIDKDNINSIIENPQLVDYVPYGTTAIPIWGSAMSSNTSNTTSASRILNIPTTAPQFMHKSPSLSEIYYYTGNIGMDFLVSPPNPLNSEKLISSINVLNKSLEIFTANGKVMFNATAGERVEIYNAVGQRVVNTLSTDGLNSISLDAKGVLLVKVGERIGKVIM